MTTDLKARLDAMVNAVQEGVAPEQEVRALEAVAMDILAKLDAAGLKISGLYSDRSRFDCRFAGPYMEMSGIHCPSDNPCQRCLLDASEVQVKTLTAERDELAAALVELYDDSRIYVVSLEVMQAYEKSKARAALKLGGDL